LPQSSHTIAIVALLQIEKFNNLNLDATRDCSGREAIWQTAYAAA
jgi:hypothetical protein